MRLVLAALIAMLVLPTAARASSCASSSGPGAHEAAAEVIVVARVLPSDRADGVLTNPVRVQALSYEKGTGPDQPLVLANIPPRTDGLPEVASLALTLKADEVWRLYGRFVDGVLETSVCTGSTPTTWPPPPPPQPPPIQVTPSVQVTKVTIPAPPPVAAVSAPTGACLGRSSARWADAVPIVFLGRALAPLDGSSVRFGVTAYEKGGGATERVVTFLRSAQARPGELWRIYGSEQDGRVVSAQCSGSHRVSSPLTPPRLRIADRSLALLPSTLAGDTAPVPAHRLATRAASVRIVSSQPLDALRAVRRGTVIARARPTSDVAVWVLTVPPGTFRLVADTGDRAYTGSLSRLSQR